MGKKNALAFALIIIVLILCSCTKYSESWSHDDSGHWHALVKGKGEPIADYSEHNWELVKTQEVTCLENGYKEYACSVCGAIKITDEIPRINHANKEHVLARNATIEQRGCIEHWYCPDCRRCFKDEECTIGMPDNQVFSYIVGGPGPAGGIVFYDKGEYSDGWRFIEAAPGVLSTDSNNDLIIQKPYYKNGYILTYSIFYYANGIETYPTKDTSSYNFGRDIDGRYTAFELCEELNYNGYDDWYLPTSLEMSLFLMEMDELEGASSWVCRVPVATSTYLVSDNNLLVVCVGISDDSQTSLEMINSSYGRSYRRDSLYHTDFYLYYTLMYRQGNSYENGLSRAVAIVPVRYF